MAWFEFTQNNSFGTFDVNNKVCHRVFIEAGDAKEANRLALDMGIYFDDSSFNIDCPCCGYRWNPVGDIDAITFPYAYGRAGIFQSIEQYAQYLANHYGWTSPDARIYYSDGQTVKEIFTGQGVTQ